MSLWRLDSTQDTEYLGAALARAFAWNANAPRLLGLHGELGAGKTTLASGLLRGLGAVGPIRSPTYSLVETYAVTAGLAVHVDLYRLQAAEELENLGLRDYFQGGTLVLVEWPERGQGALPATDLQVTLTVVDDARRALLTAQSPAGMEWLAALEL